MDSRSSSRYVSRQASPHPHPSPNLTSFPSPTQFHATSTHTLRAHLHPSLPRLRIEAAGKFIAYEARRRQVDAYVPESPGSPLIPISMHQKLPSDPFERFAFDALFTQSDAEDLEDGLAGRIEGAPPTESENWETDLSKLVALRKREVLDRRSTFRGRSEERDAIRGKLEEEAIRGKLEEERGGETFRGRPTESLRVRQPLPPLRVDTPAYTTSETNSPMPADTPAYTASPILSSRDQSRSPALTITSGPDDEGVFDPLHLPSILNLLVSLIRERLRRIFLNPPPGGLPSYITDTGACVHEKEEEWEEKEREPVKLTLPVVGVLVAAAAASGYWAGSHGVGRVAMF